MPRVLVILPTQTYRATDFIKAGDELGVDLIVASEAEPPIEMGDRYIKIDCSDPRSAADTIVAVGDTTPIDGIVAADDSGVVVAALAGSRLGLPANSPDSAAAARNKETQRIRFQTAEVPQPHWAALKKGEDPDQVAGGIGYPLVVKPLSRSAGQGVIRVDNPDELMPAINRVNQILPESECETLLLEAFMSGEEVAVEGLIAPDGFIPLTIFDKPSPLQGLGFQETILVAPSRQPEAIQRECLRVATASIDALGLSRGPVHIELMIVGNQVFVIEVAARSIGGLCSKSLSFGLMGTSLESLILRNALGLDKPELRRAKKAGGVLMIPIPSAGKLVALHGLDDVRALEGVTGIDITASPGEYLAPPPEGARYLGFVFAEATEPEIVESTLMKAMDRIKVEMR